MAKQTQKQLEIWQDPAKELGEVLLDEALEKSAPGLAKVPLLSTLIAAIQSGNAWSDYLLARKVQLFYTAWETLPKTERKTMYEKFQKKPRDFIEKLLFILDKQEDGQKCRVLGMLTVQYLRAEIRRADYYDLIETVTQLSFSDLTKLAELLTHQSVILPERRVGERYANTFLARGLLVTAPFMPREQRASGRAFQLTKLGRLLAHAIEHEKH